MTFNSFFPIPAICLVAALAMAPVAPEAGNIIFLAGSAFGLLLIWPRATSAFSRPIIWMPLVGMLMVGAAYVVTAGPEGLMGLLFFAPVLAILPLTVLLRDTDLPPFLGTVGLLALCGTAGAAAMAVFEFQTTGTERAGNFVANPIHFADVALLVGLIGLVGAVRTSGWVRVLFLTSPLVAIIPVALSGTRGAMIALAAALVVGTVTAVAVRLVSRRAALVGLASFLILAVVALLLGANQLSGVQRVFTDIVDTLANGVPTDQSTDLRLQMYLGGFRAFLESPIFGHGPLLFNQVANGLADGSFSDTPHLHSDLVDMGASAGIVGLVAYLLMILAPIAEAVRMPGSTNRKWSIFFAVTFVASFVVMGLTNAMFGVLTVTISYVAGCIVIGVMSVSAEAEKAP